MAEASVTVVGAGVTGSGNAGELAYFNSPVGITGVPGSIVAGGQVTFGSTVTVVGTLAVTARVNITGNFAANSALSLQSNLTALGAQVIGLDVVPTIIPVQNGSTIIMLRALGAVTPGAFTGLQFIGLQINGINVGTWSAPADPIALQFGNINGGGLTTNAYQIKFGATSGATNNYVMQHANFAILQSGLFTSAGGIELTAGTLRIDTGGSTVISTGTGTIKMSTVNNANSAVWIPVNYNGTTYFVPGFTTNAP